MGPESGGPLEFLIPASGDDYLDLSHCYLYMKCQVLKADGSPIEMLKSDTSRGADASVVPMYLLFHSLFRQLDLVMNDALVAMSGDTYPYRTYLTMLFSYGCIAKETWLKHLEGCQTDEDGKYNAQENLGLISRRKTISNNSLFDFNGRLHSNMLLQERLMRYNMNVQLVLSCSWPAFYLMDFGVKPEYHVSIEEAILEVGKVKVTPSEQVCLEMVLNSSGAKYPLAQMVTRHFTLAAGASMANVDALFNEQIPTKFIIVLVSNVAFISAWKKNSFNFPHVDLNSGCLVVDGRPLLAQSCQLDFERGLYAET